MGHDLPTEPSEVLNADRREQSVPGRFEQVVRQYPDRLAIKISNRLVTYFDLNAMANRVARAVLAQPGSRTGPVALLLQKDAPLIAAMLGVLKAGRFFVLLDPSFPLTRVSNTLKDSQAPLMITDETNISLAGSAAGAGCRVLDFGSIDPATSADDLRLPIESDALAFLIYTSGSTGEPKGVMETHENLLHRLLARATTSFVRADDCVALLSSGVANSISDTFMTLLIGATLLPYDVKAHGVTGLAEWVAREEISICYFASPLFRSFCETLTGAVTFPALRVIRLRSENVYKTDVDLWRKHFPATCALLTGLSSTETGPLTTYQVDRNMDIIGPEVPVGFAVADKEILLFDDDGQQVGFNKVGEIAVRSRYLFPGYWGRPDLTAAKFTSDPAGAPGRIYLTGDLGLMRPDGCLIHKGRKDYRIKVRGYGVDVPEIEKVLMTHPAIQEIVVVPRHDGSSGTSLVAYFTTADDSAPSVSELRSALQDRLPDYMIPSAFIRLPAIPLTPHGKVDRRALPDLETSRPNLASAFAAPSTRVEKQLARIWEDTLGVRPIGIHDDFIELGGHSLLVSQLSVRISRDLQIDFPVRELFEAPTIARVATAIEAKRGPRSTPRNDRAGEPALVTLQSGGNGKTVFCFPYASGFLDEYIHLTRLARLLGREYSFYGLAAPGADGASLPPRHLVEMAEGYATAIQTVQPHGPYFIIGDCGGCPEAYETSRRLRARGEKVALLVVMDDEGWRPRWRYRWRQLTGRPRHRLDLITESWAWNHLKQKMGSYLRRLRQLRRGEWVRSLAGTLSRASEIVSDLRREFDSFPQPTAPKARSARQARKAHYLARCRYRHGPYDGRITLVVNEEWYEWHRRHDSDSTLGWSRLAGGGVDVHKIPGNHLTYITENIHVVAEVIRKSLRETDESVSCPELEIR